MNAGGMRCPAHGTFMRRLTPTGHRWYCTARDCREMADDRPDVHWGLFLLGFASKAARP